MLEVSNLKDNLQKTPYSPLRIYDLNFPLFILLWNVCVL